MDTFELLIYHTAQEDASIEVVLKDETIWATQKAMAQLFGIQVPGISKHVNNILREGELQADKVISKMETTTAHGAIEGLTMPLMDAFSSRMSVLPRTIWMPSRYVDWSER